LDCMEPSKKRDSGNHDAIKDYQEVPLGHGIYVTDFRSKGQPTVSIPQNSSNGITTTISQNQNPELQLQQIKELENSIRHLIRSNIELTEVLNDDPDPLYYEALQENKLVIQKRQIQLKQLKELLNQTMTQFGERQQDQQLDSANEMEVEQTTNNSGIFL